MEVVSSNREAINPREFALEHGEAGIAALMRERAGYVPQERPLIDFVESLFAEMPLLAEGGAGSGKTAFGEAVADTFGLPKFYLQCMPQLTMSQVLYTTDGTQGRLTRENIFLCDPLAAYDYCVTNNVPPVLIVDELDKATMDVENMLLQIFGRRYAHIPNLYPSSVVGIKDPKTPGPIVIVTSNALRELTEPMRSRCLYTFFRNPTPAEEVAIIRSQAPSAPAELVKAALKVLQFARTLNAIRSQPGLRESIAFINALARKKLTALTVDTLRRHLTYIARNRDDLATFEMKLQLLASVSTRSVPEIDRRVERVFSAEPSRFLQEVA